MKRIDLSSLTDSDLRSLESRITLILLAHKANQEHRRPANLMPDPVWVAPMAIGVRSPQRHRSMRTVVIESPFAGDVDLNQRYARAAMLDCLRRGEAPFASHLLYTQPGLLNDAQPEERAIGIEAGFVWAAAADARAVYVDLGISRGMQAGIDHAESVGQQVEVRYLDGWAK